jgi:hypothetical protein
LRASRPFLRNASLAALLAVFLNALWPLIVHAKPANAPLLVPVCSVEGTTHYVEVERGDSPLDKRSSAQHDHCKLCFFGAERPAVLPLLSPVLSLEASNQVAAQPPTAPAPASPFLSTARPRAPPAVS